MSAEAMRDVKASGAPLRPVRLGPADVLLDRKADGTLYLRSPHKLDSYPDKLTQRLEHRRVALRVLALRSLGASRFRRGA